MDIFYEQNVVNNNIDERAKKTKALVIAKTVCLVLGLFVIVTGAMAINIFWVFIITSLPFFGGAFVISRINKRNNTEYDYVLDDEYLKISEIYFRERRKLKHKIRLRLVDSVGVFESDGYKRCAQSASKKILALVNYEDEQSIIYILYNSDKGKRIIFIEPDRGFMIALRRALPSLTVFDRSVSEFEKRLDKIQSQRQAEFASASGNFDDSENTAEDDDNHTDTDIVAENENTNEDIAE